MTAPILLATCREWSQLPPDDRPLLALLREAGFSAVPAVWDDPSVAWHEASAVVLRATWDYSERREDFLRWLDGLRAPVFNPPDVVRWNTDKRYLSRLEAAGLAVTPTVYLDPGQGYGGELACAEVVIKPTVSAGSRNTLRLPAIDERAIAEHLERIHRAGKTAMIQPYQHDIERLGETALIYLDGTFSHAIRKAPLLPERGRLATEGLFAKERIEPREATPAELELGAQVMRALPFEPLLYARVDLVPGFDGAPLILEVELSEPSLFLEWGPGSHHRLIAALRSRLGLSS